MAKPPEGKPRKKPRVIDRQLGAYRKHPTWEQIRDLAHAGPTVMDRELVDPELSADLMHHFFSTAQIKRMIKLAEDHKKKGSFVRVSMYLDEKGGPAFRATQTCSNPNSTRIEVKNAFEEKEPRAVEANIRNNVWNPEARGTEEREVTKYYWSAAREIAKQRSEASWKELGMRRTYARKLPGVAMMLLESELIDPNLLTREKRPHPKMWLTGGK